MGWSCGNSRRGLIGFRSYKMCSLRSVLGCSSDTQKSGDSDNRCLSQSLCPLLYNVCNSGEEGVKGGAAEVKKTAKGENTEPPEYYQQAYFFEDNDSDDNSVSDISPLIHRPTTHSSPSQHIHLITGYLSAVEVILLVIFAGSLVGLTASHHKWDGTTAHDDLLVTTAQPCYHNPDKIVAYFCMLHVLVWAIVGVFDRVVQWRHQALRKKGYLKFYRKMRNIRRLPFIFVSLINAVILLFVSLLYIFKVQEEQLILKLHSVDFLYIIIGLELILTLPCLIYYIVRATQFNYAQQAPDVIQDTYSGTTSPTNSVTAVGFRDGEDLDELLERQADMIRYLQQHNANLGRRILELQSQALE